MYRWVDHTGELELEIVSETEEGVLVEAVRALGEVLGDEDPADAAEREPAESAITLAAADRARLFAAWLAELAFLAETEGLVPEGVRDLRLGEGTVNATVHGHRGEPPHLIKAVTYHHLTFEPADGGWRARAVLDV